MWLLADMQIGAEGVLEADMQIGAEGVLEADWCALSGKSGKNKRRVYFENRFMQRAA